MISHVKNWFKNFQATYIGNAHAVRDFRSQLRGTRPLVFWGAYLGTLILTATIAYGNLVRDGQDFAAGQQALHAVYQILMALLGIVICVAAPALTATAITQERQRRSLDLVACAPITTRYYLVGKMLSSFRYIWMLLILSLPVTSMCVVLGGATWGDVLSGYDLLSASGLVMTSLCLLLSSLFKSGIAALNGAYLFIAGIYLPATAALATQAYANSSLEAPWYGGLFPLVAPLAAPTFTSIFGMMVPNYIIVWFFSLVAVRYVLLGTASVMGHYGSNDIRKFRQSTLVVAALLSVSSVVSLHNWYLTVLKGGGDPIGPWASALGQMAAPLGIALMFLTCYLSVYSRSADERFRNDGTFDFRKIWLGTPAGSLPYILLLTAVTLGVLLAYGVPTMGAVFAGPMVGAILWCLGGIFTAWCLARAASVRNMTIAHARLASGLVLAAMFAVPSMILTLLETMTNGHDIFASDLWKLSFIAILIGRIDAVSVCCQLLLMAIFCGIALRNLKRANFGASSRGPETATDIPSGFPLPNHAESIYPFDTFGVAGEPETISDFRQEPFSKPTDNP